MNNWQILKGFWVSLSCFALTSSTAWADGAAVPASPQGAAGSAAAAAAGSAPQTPFGMLMPFALMFGVVYFLMIRPQQKKMKDQQSMLAGLKHGDGVITASGLLGTVSGITDKVVTLEVATNVKIKMLKSQVAQIVKGPIKDLT